MKTKNLILPIALLLAAPVFAQQQPAPRPPGEVVTPKHQDMLLPLKLAVETQLNDQIRINAIVQQANSQINPLVAESKEQQAIIDSETKKIKDDNKWGDDVFWSPERKQFERSAAPPEKK